MDSLILFIIGCGVAFTVTIIKPFFVLPLFIFGHFVLPMQYFPELRQYNPTTILGIIVLIAWILHTVIFKDFEPVQSRQVVMMVLFLFWAFLSSRVHYETSWGMFMIYIRTFIPYFLFVYLIKTRRQLSSIIWLLLIFGAVAGIYGIYCLKANIGLRDRGVVRITSFFSNPNAFGQTLTLLVPLALGLLFYKYPGSVKTILVLIMVFIITGIVISYSRKCFFALIAGIFFFVFKFFKKEKKLPAVALTCVLLLLAAYVFPDAPKYRFWARVRTIFRAESAEQLDAGRTETTKAGLEMMLRNPVLGVGLGGFIPEYVRIASTSQDIALVGEQGLDPHCLYIEVGAKLGVIGLAFYLLLIMYAFKDALSAERKFLSQNDDLLRIIAASYQVFLGLFLFIGVFSGIMTSKIFWMVVPLSAVLKRLSLQGVGCPIETTDQDKRRDMYKRIRRRVS